MPVEGNFGGSDFSTFSAMANANGMSKLELAPELDPLTFGFTDKVNHNIDLEAGIGFVGEVNQIKSLSGTKFYGQFASGWLNIAGIDYLL